MKLKNLHIHILENNAVAGFDLKCQLEKLGHTVKYDVSLSMDFNDRFPDMIVSNTAIQSQADFAALKDLCIESQVPIICVGSQVDFSTMQKCSGVNIVGKFAKPFDSDDIVKVIVDYFNKTEVEDRRGIVNESAENTPTFHVEQK